jgi:hypothetical protein
MRGMGDMSVARFSFMVQAIPVLTRATPTANRVSITEGYVSQPVAMARASLGEHLSAAGTLDLEGLTLRRGELSTGASGEGYVDRRHPHTYLHELLIGASGNAGSVDVSLFAGRGFASFGSDDPMMRPMEKFPLNHHLAQILERGMAVGAARYRAFTIEGSVFNGDEPTGPSSLPNWSRFADSWATRATVRPVDELELSTSYAFVRSPESRTDDGTDQRKWSSAVRYARDLAAGRSVYMLFEWARTREEDSLARGFTYRTLLGETACRTRALGFAVRVERTDRPEETRLADPFRSPRPPNDVSNLGITRWTTTTVHMDTPARILSISSAPFVEIARALVQHGSQPGVFDPTVFYGGEHVWMVSAGVRLAYGMHDMRMGRYGVALPSEATPMIMR